MGKGQGKGEEAWLSEDQSGWALVDNGESNGEVSRGLPQERGAGSESETSREAEEIQERQGEGPLTL